MSCLWMETLPMTGEYTRWGPREVVVDEVRGHNLDTNQRYAYSEPEEVNRGFNRRSETIQSDRVWATPFSRESVWTEADVPYHVWEETRWPNGDLYEWRESVRHISRQVPDPAFWAPPDGWSARLGNAEDRAITTARSRLRQKDSTSVGVSIAEARKTAEMLAKRGGDMASGLIALRRYANSLSSGGRAKLLALGGAWLEGTYGWGSLARDAFDLDKRLRSELDRELLIKASSVIRISESFPESGGWLESSDWNGLAKCGYTAKIEDAFARNLDGWGLINPLSIAWETVPYSFCVDWIVPIGNTLSSLTATAGLEFRAGYLSTVTNATVRRRRPARPWESLIQEGLHRVRMKRFDRMRLTAFLPPRLYANENPFSTPRILSGLALITKAVLGR